MLTFLLCSFAFTLGFFAKHYIENLKDSAYTEYYCPDCKLVSRLPKYCRWSHRHECNPFKSETLISRKTIPDLVEPKEKISGEGKTIY